MLENERPQERFSVSDLRDYISKLSDRAIQRIVGSSSFLRGRVYARRNVVQDLDLSETEARGKISIRNDEPLQVELELDGDGAVASRCNCSSWRGPKGHCKHVAALLISLRDRERPPRSKPNPSERTPVVRENQSSESAASSEYREGGGGSLNRRRRSKRRRRNGGMDGTPQLGPVEVFSARELGINASLGGQDNRGGLDVWLAPEELTKPQEFDFRLAVRSASIAVTPVLAGTRTAIPIAEALAGFTTVAPPLRPLFRALQRNASRTQPATAEFRGEEAAEMLSMLQGRRVLLEPASMELRFSDDALKPRIELDASAQQSVRMRVVFEAKSNGRRFSLSNGAWFEGTPGWMLDSTEGVARPLAESVTSAWLQRLYRSPSLVHPMQDLPRLLGDFIPRVATSLGAELPDLSSVADVVDAHPQFALRAKGDLVEARVRLRVSYDKAELDVSTQGFPSPLAFQPQRDTWRRPRVIRRDVGAEMAAVQELMNLGFEVDPETSELVAKGEHAIQFWSEGIGKLPETWDRFIPNDLVDITIRSAPVVPRMRLASGVDWLSLDMSFDAGGHAVSEEELRMCLAQGRRLVKLQDGSYAPIQSEQVSEVLERMAEIYAGQGANKKISLSQAGRVQDLMKLVANQAVTDSAKDLFGKLNEVGSIEQVAKPRNLKATLRPYQKEGFSWLVFLHNLGTGGILADDMGLGKTLQAIALLLWCNKDKTGPTLVVAPTSVVPNWEREIEKFGPSLKAVVWQGPDRHELAEQAEKADVIITSYALLRRDEEFLHKRNYQYVILDEAQHIKNPFSATARAAKKLPSHRRLALTGTPIENRLSEIWSIFDFVSPGLLGNLAQFEERYARPIERGDEEAARKLRSTVHPFVMRRTKVEVAKDLPEKIEQEMFVPLAEEQAKLYEQILRQVRESVLSEIDQQGIAQSQIQILAALTRLRQVACDPRLLKLDGDWDKEESGKLNALREIMSEAVSGGHRVLVFSQFVEMLKLIRDVFDREEIRYEYLDGSTKDRQARVDRFNTDERLTAFLISLKAGGTGLNLTGADTVVHFDPWWNPAVEDQATDRAHRIGQTKVVNVYRLLAKGTVEEKILQLSEKKRSLVSQVLSSDGAPLKGLSREDVTELFS